MFPTCEFQPALTDENEVTQIIHHGKGFAEPLFAKVVQEAYDYVAPQPGAYADAYAVRAVVCNEIRVQPKVFARCLSELIEAGPASRLGHLYRTPVRSTSSREDYIEVGRNRIGLLKLTKLVNGEEVMALQSFFQTAWDLKGNPFSGKATYAEDNQMVYVKEMFGNQHDEFLRKFVVAPLENGQPLMGAVWSVLTGRSKGSWFWQVDVDGRGGEAHKCRIRVRDPHTSRRFGKGGAREPSASWVCELQYQGKRRYRQH